MSHLKIVMRNSLLLIILFAILIPLHAVGDISWSRVGFSGGDISDLAGFHSNPDILLALVADYGLFRSTDHGEQWTQIIKEPFNDMSISVDDVAFIAGNSGVFVSYDTGETWSACLDSAAVCVVAHCDGIVTANISTDKNHNAMPWWLSRDNGVTWQEWKETESTKSFLFLLSGTVYRSTIHDLYRSEADDWNTWTQVASFLNSGPALRFGFAESDSMLYAYSTYADHHPMGYVDGGVFTSTDNGATWPKKTSIESVSMLDHNGSTLVIGTPDGVLSIASTSSEEYTVIGEFGGTINAVDVKRIDAGELIIATDGGIFKTLDGGQSWQKSDAGIMYPKISSVQVIPVGSNDERLLVSTQNSGIYYSDDDGDSWILADPSVRTIPGVLKVSESLPRCIYAGESSINMSRDNGETWELVPNLPASYYSWYGRTVDIDIDPNDTDRIVVNYYDHSVDHLIGISFHDGRFTENSEYPSESSWNWNEPMVSWQAFRSQFSNDGSLIWISTNSYMAPVEPLITAFNESGEIVHTITLPEEACSHYWLIDGEKCYAFSENENRFWRSSDLGITWEYTDLNLYEYVQYDDWCSAGYLGEITLSPDSEILYLLYPGNGILASKDGGQTWSAFNNGFETNIVYQLAFSTKNSTVVYAAAADGLYRSDELSDIKNIEDRLEKPAVFIVSQNYPNPFNPSTTISYNLPKSANITISIYNTSGQRVAILKDEYQQAGSYSSIWNAQGFPTGLYFFTVEADGFRESRKMMLVK